MLKKSLLLSLAAFTALLPLQAQMSMDACNECENRFWLEADYLYWQVQDCPKVIPLVVEQPVVDGPYKVVLGGKKIKNDWHSGAKFTLGGWYDECHNLGAEINYFFLAKNSKHSSVSSDANGAPRLRVPYFNVTTGQPDSTALSTPGLFKGKASLKVSNDMQGAELNIIKDFYDSSCFKVLAGFRYWNFEDNLTFFVNSPLVAIPTVYNYQDQFLTENNFYGGQLGASFKQNFSCFIFDVKGKIALGALCRKSTIKGRFKTNEFTGSVETFSGGFFALPTNIGSRKKTKFSVISELNLNVGYLITDCFCVHAGYSVMYATEVLRASKQMSSRLNPTQSANIEFTPTPALVGEPAPKAKLRSSNLWAQGLTAGLDFTF